MCYRRLVFSIIPVLMVAFQVGLVDAQTRRPRNTASVREQESNAKKAELQYLSQLAGLAEAYEQNGDFDNAVKTLQRILKISPSSQKVRDKIKELENKVFENNQRELEIDSSKGWIVTGVKVTKGEPVRIVAKGSYKFIVNTDLGPDGFPTGDIVREMGAGVKCGALMGSIVAPARPGGRPSSRSANAKPGKPFTVGSEFELKPDRDGVLMLKLNVPPGSKCIGKVKVTIAGNIAPAR